MNLIQLSTRRPVAITMVTIAVMLFGFVSLSRLPVNLLPDLSYPTLTVRTELVGAAPTEIETLLTKPLEETLGVTKGIRQVRSVSRPGQSDVTLEFNWGTRMEFAVLDVRERLDQLELPKEASRPVVLRFDPSEDPIMRYGLALQTPKPRVGEGVEEGAEPAPQAEQADLPPPVATETDLKRLRRIAEDLIQKPMEGTDGIAAVKISGGLKDEVQVLVDLQKLAQLNLTVEAIAARLQAENANISGGRVDQGSYSYLVRTLNQFVDLDEIRDTIISNNGAALAAATQGTAASGLARPLYVRDVAEVRRGYAEREAIIRIDGAEAVEIAVYKEGDANTVRVAELAEFALNNLRKNLPADVQLRALYDQSVFIREAISGVTGAALFGGLLAILVLYLFLRSAWTTAVVSVAIPVSVIATFMLMHSASITLNIMSLGGIALAIGMLVDNAIVVLENIARKREEGADAITAAAEGASEMGPAVTASTLTTVAVFFPMVFVEGIAGQLFSDQALVVTGALLVSLAVAMTLIPMLASRDQRDPASVQARPETPIARVVRTARWFKDLFVVRIPAAAKWLLHWLPRFILFPLTLVTQPNRILRLGVVLRRFGWFLFEFVPSAILWIFVTAVRILTYLPSMVMPWVSLAWQRIFTWLVGRYRGGLRWALGNRTVVMVIALGLFAFSIVLLGRIGVELIPPFNQGEFRAEVTMPPGTPLEATDALLRDIAAPLSDDPRVHAQYVVAGTGNRLDANAESGGENFGVINIVLKPEAFNEEAAVMATLRERMRGRAGLTYNFTRPTLFTLKNPLEVEIAGYNLEAISATARTLEATLKASGRYTEIESSQAPGHPEIQIKFDQERAAALNLDTAQLAQRVSRAVQGSIATRYRIADREIDVLVRGREQDRSSVAAVRSLVINPESNRPLTLSSVAEVSLSSGPSEIRRTAQQRVIVISAGFLHDDLGAAVTEMQDIIHAMRMPQGVNTYISGQREEMETSFKSLQLALALAIFLVYLVMASQFESLLHPFVILFTIPLAAIGAIFGLYLTGSVINVVALIGSIVLAGIVVNNGIVLIDLINRNRGQGMSRTDAILDAGPKRLRPILMTTMTTVLGLLPLALGSAEGAEVRAPMAITVIGGLMGSAVLTLFVIPVVYTLLDFGKRGAAAEPAAQPVVAK